MGSVHLIKEPQPLLSYRVFNGLVNAETPGLCISIFPSERVREWYGVRDSRIVWLADTPGEDNVRPTALYPLLSTIVTFVKTNAARSVVLVDGLERLITRNEFDPAFKWVEQLSEFVAPTSAIVLVPFSPDTVGRKDLANLERVLVTFEGSTLAEELAAAELSRMIASEE